MASTKTIGARIGAGVAAGLISTCTMSAVMALAKGAGLLGEPPPRKLVRRVLGRTGLVPSSGPGLSIATAAAHLGFGATMGALFALPHGRRARSSSVLGGSLFGLGVWAVSYAGWIPKLGLMAPPSRDRLGRPASMVAAHLVFGATLGAVLPRLSQWAGASGAFGASGSLRGKVGVVCGGSRGLGRAIARELAKKGMSVAICARSADDLESARTELEAYGVAVMAEVCDLRREDETLVFLTSVAERLGEVDVLVTNAATITVAPIETTTPSDFKDAMESIFDTALHPALTVLSAMQARRAGTIAFITSIGGKVGVPHLAPYSAAKFAEVGFAEALRAEVAKDGVRVLTVVPGLMRTGSHLRAGFRGDPEKELGWFGASAMAPGLSIDADRAAKRIVRAIERGHTRLVYTLPARIAARTHDLMPNVWSFVMGIAGRLLPKAPAPERVVYEEGRTIAATSASPLVDIVASRSREVAERHGQI